MNSDLRLFLYPFPVFSNKILWAVLSAFDVVVYQCIFIPSYNVLRVVFLSSMSYNTAAYIFLIRIAVGARSVYLAVSIFIVRAI